MDMKDAAARGFSLLAKQYADAVASDAFKKDLWFAGNTFHTLLDYMIEAGVNDAQQKPQIVPLALQVFMKLRDTANWWVDDYGWWGDAFLLARANRKALGYDLSPYDPLFIGIATAAADCWTRMHRNWSDTPYDASSDHANGSAPISGGVYNDKDDPTWALTGRNSVTNEGYWLLSMGLRKLQPTNPDYTQAVTDIETWMKAWLAPTPTCDGTGQIGILDTQCHVLERPMGTENAATWFWTGDQGLFCRALDTSGVETTRLSAILTATADSQRDQAYVLHENMAFTKVYSDFTADYATGKGIFLRSVGRLSGGPGNLLAKVIVLSAAAVWNNRNQVSAKPDPHRDPDQFTFNWNGNLQPQYEPLWLTSKGPALDNLIMQTAGQDALNTALALNLGTELA
jgi:hypothetical protein